MNSTALLISGRKTPLIFDAHGDFIAEMDLGNGQTGYFGRLLKLVLRAFQFLINLRATHIIAVTDGVAKAYDEKKTTIVRNLPILGETYVKSRVKLANRPRDICYIGAISEIRGLKELVIALEHTKTVRCLQLAGNIETEKFGRTLKSLPGWSKVKYHGFVDRVDVLNILNNCRVGVVTLHPTKNHQHSIPIKLLEYLCAGLPVLASTFCSGKNFWWRAKVVNL